MKKLLILIFSLFFLSSPSVFADDISDFEIEGMSIGDSLLDYMSEDEILSEIEKNKGGYVHLKESDKYIEVYFFGQFEIYDWISFKVRNKSESKYVTDKNEKYTILSIRGQINYIEDFDSCLIQKDEVLSELSKVFINAQKSEMVDKHGSDPSGNSIVDAVLFEYDSGEGASIYCVNFEETFRLEKNWSEGLNISIKSSEINAWLSNYK